MATTKLGLILPAHGPAPGGLISVDDLADNFQKIDDFFGVVICTSGTRPSSPYAAQQIYETDTRMTYVRNAANTTWIMLDRVPSVAATGDIAAPYTGQLIWVTAVNLLYRYTGSAWSVISIFTHSSTQTVATAETTTSTSYTDLATVGPNVTLTSVGIQAMVIYRATTFAGSGTDDFDRYSAFSFEVSGATATAASDGNMVSTMIANNSGFGTSLTGVQIVTITPGTNTYRMKYKMTGTSTAVYSNRRIMVIAP